MDFALLSISIISSVYLFCNRVWIHCFSSVWLYEALGNLKPYPTVCDFNLIQSPKSSPTYLLTEVQSNLVSFCPVSNILKGWFFSHCFFWLYIYFFFFWQVQWMKWSLNNKVCLKADGWFEQKGCARWPSEVIEYPKLTHKDHPLLPQINILI